MASKWIRRFSGFRQLVLILACLQFVSHSLGAYHRVESMEIATSVMGSDAEELAYEIGKRKILNRNDMLSSGEFSLQSTHLFSRETFKENSWFPECSVCEELLPPPESVWTNAGHQNDHRPSQPKLRAAPDGEECCKVNGAEADCRYCDLRTVPSRLSPEITRLLLGHNAITDKSLSRGVFKRYSQLKLLSLSSNLITSLADGIFEGLPSLRCLCLQFNNIRMDDTLNSSLAFQPLAESLVYLRLNGFNKNTTDINMMYPSYALSFLSKLKYLFIDGIPFTRFQNPQRKLHKLTHLGMAGFRYGYCNLRGLQREAFELDTLTHLDISDCNLRGIYVDKSAFENLQSLQSLKISNNFHLGIQKAGEMMYGLRNNRHLTTLTMQRINPRFSPCIVVYKSTLQYFQNTGLERIYAMDNEIETIERGALKLLPKTLKYLNIANNNIVFGDYIADLRELKGLTHLKLDSTRKSYGFPFVYPTNVLSNCAGNLTLSSGTVSSGRDEDPYIKKIPLPPNLSELSMSGNDMMYSLNNMSFSKNKLKIVNLTLNIFKYLDGSIKGFEKVQTLKLDLCLIKRISCEFFKYFHRLQHLYLSQNLLSGTLDGDHDGCIFKNLKRLKSLGLALNDIFRLNPKSFKSLTNLQYLNISQNRLHQINFSIAHMKNLKILDLQKNQIQSLSRQTRLEIDKISEGREPPLMNLSYNPISCDCENLEFLEWLSGTALADFDFRGAPYYCGMEQQANGYRDVIVLLRRRCIKQEELFAVVTSASIVAVLAFAALFAYRFRWTLRYWYHAARLKFQPVVSPEDFDFDVFVSYSDKDDFVEEELIPRLQDEYNFRVMMHGLCFPAGAHITDSVHTAVTTSRKTLVVITKNMLRSHWCNYELMVSRSRFKKGRTSLTRSPDLHS
ncbi:hypothetical protein RRG08_061657 [Elysia crispata]|uniref:TIR domain-containing protein n=1 Tax=Elysia crispata TaxID=231223 RepID=A0AAE0Z547_9GAST|nr:hypothetical protein RRG08_061657 [Elysia crispata]